MAAFERLPNEVLQAVFRDRNLSIDDHLALALTNKRFHAIVLPAIYSRFPARIRPARIRPVFESTALTIAIFDQFCSTIRQNRIYAQQVRFVELVATGFAARLEALSTCPGLELRELRFIEFTSQCLAPLSSTLNPDSRLARITSLDLQSPSGHNWRSFHDVMDLLSCLGSFH